MIYKLQISDVLFRIQSSALINWKPEDYNFFYEGQPYSREILVNISLVDSLPNLIHTEQYSMSGLKVGLDTKGNEVRRHTALFCANRPDYAISVLENDTINIFFSKTCNLWNNPNISIWTLLYLEHILLNSDALVLHCSYIVYQNEAILFTAPSGTGKTTQAKLWEKLSDAKIVNGDRAVIKRISNKWYACGCPFHGTALECDNQTYPIRAISIVRQHSHDSIIKLSQAQNVGLLYSEISVNSWNHVSINNVLDLILDLILDTTVIQQNCTLSDDAYYTLHNYLEGEI